MVTRDGSMTFSEADVRKILERAGARSERRLGASALDLDELCEAAKEVGIAREDVERAIAELESDDESGGPLHFLFGGPGRVALERSIACEVSDEALLDLRQEIEHAVGLPGRGSISPRGFTWTGFFIPGSPRVSITRARGRATVRIDARYHGLAGALFGGVGAGGAGAFGAPAFGLLLAFTHSWLIALSAGLAATLASFGLARWIYGDVVKKRRRKLQKLLLRLIEALETAKT